MSESGMVVGVCEIALALPGNTSLKGKRRVIRSIKDRVKNRYNVSVAEVGDLDSWQQARIGLSMVGNSKSYVQSVLSKVVNYIDDLGLAMLVDEEMEVDWW